MKTEAIQGNLHNIERSQQRDRNTEVDMEVTPHAWTNLAVFNNHIAAKALKNFLEKEGLESRLYDERTLQRFWFLSHPRGGSQVQVRKESLETAKQTLDSKREGSALLQKAIRCPSCQSLRVQYPQMTRKFMLPTLVAQVGIFFGVMQRECYCEDCHHTWVKIPRVTAKSRVRCEKKPRSTYAPSNTSNGKFNLYDH